jgi:NhaP-type Na+/H+ or K+/H+ antiporter
MKQPPIHYLFDFLAEHPKSIGFIFIAMLVVVQALFLRDPVKMILMFVFLIVARFLGYFEAMWDSVEKQLEQEEREWTTRTFVPEGREDT